MLILLDWLLTLTHALVVVSILSLWAFRRTRRWHLVLVSLTAASWVGLGYWHGFGYCFLTDWHWRIKAARGITDVPSSFIKYVVYSAGGTPISASVIDAVTGLTFAAVFALSIALNFMDSRR